MNQPKTVVYEFQRVEENVQDPTGILLRGKYCELRWEDVYEILVSDPISRV